MTTGGGELREEEAGPLAEGTRGFHDEGEELCAFLLRKT